MLPPLKLTSASRFVNRAPPPLSSAMLLNRWVFARKTVSSALSTFIPAPCPAL
jgi:hypothetical protein